MSNKFLINSRCASRPSTSSPPYGHAKYQSSHSSVISTVYLRRHQRNCLPMNDCRSKLKQNQKKKISKIEKKNPACRTSSHGMFYFLFLCCCCVRLFMFASFASKYNIFICFLCIIILFLFRLPVSSTLQSK